MEFVVDAFVATKLEGMVAKARQFLLDAGFERWTIRKWNFQNKNTDFPELLGFSALIKNLFLTGVSDFVVHQLYFTSLNSKVFFDVSIPKLFLSIGKGEVKLNFFGLDSIGEANGHVTIIEARVVGEAVLNMADNFALRNVEMKFKLKEIKSKVHVKFNDKDYSYAINTFLMKTVPDFIKKNEGKINEAIAMGILLNRT